MSPLEPVIIKKGQVNKKTLLELKKELELKVRDYKEYLNKAIINIVVYSKQVNG